MACSKYASTKQTTHAARVSRLLLDPCTDLLRDVFRHYIPETSFPGKLQSEVLKIKPLLNASQRVMLYPQRGTFIGNYQDFDISLLYLLLRNMAGINQHAKGWGKTPNSNDRSVSANIERIRNIRNTYIGHINQSSMSDSQFNSVWKEVRIIASELVKDVGLTTDYVGLIDRLEHEPMDPELEQAYIQKHNDTELTVAELKEEQAALKKTQQRQNVQLETFNKSRVTETLKIKGKQRRMESEQYSLKKKMRHIEESHDPEARNILDSTKVDLQKHKLSDTYIRTKQVDVVIRKLHDQNVVILTGRAGEGKSTIARQVLWELSEHEEYLPVIITKSDQWDKVVNPYKKMIVYIDDIFGSTNVDNGAVEKWIKILKLRISSANKGKILVLISSRSTIIAEVRKSCEKNFLSPEYEVDLASNVLTEKEKENMLLQYEKVHVYRTSELNGDKFRKYETRYGKDAVYKLSEWKKFKIVMSEPYYGFPQTCFLFFARKEFFQLGTNFFLRPNKLLFQNIDNMRKSTDVGTKIQYCTLVYVFLQGNVHLRDLKEDIFQEICDKSNLPKMTVVDVEDAVQDLEGIYLSPSNQTHVFIFRHITIREAVAASFGKLAPDIVIQKCSDDILDELIRTEGYEARDGEVILTIRKKYYPLLADRLWSEGIWDYVYHPATDDAEFTPVLFDVINKSPHNSRTIIKEIWDELEDADKPALCREILTRHGPHHIKHKTEYDSDVSVDKYDSDTSVESEYDSDVSVDKCDSDTSADRPYLITREKVKRRLDHNLYKGHKQTVIVIRYVISNCDVNYFLNSYNHYRCRIHGMSVLHCCVTRGWTDLVDEILNAVTPTKTEENWSCLHFATFFGRYELFKKFEKLSSNVLETTREGYNILQVVLLGQRYGMYRWDYPFYYLSMSDTANNGVCFYNISENETDFVNILQHVMTGYPSLITSIDMPLDRYNNNIIHYLVIHDRHEIYDMLVNKNKDLIFRRNNTELTTTLHVAAYLGRVKFVEKLWKAGVRAEVADLSIAKCIESGQKYSDRTVTYENNSFIHGWQDQQYTSLYNIKLKCIAHQTVPFGCTEDYTAISSICTADN